MDTKKIEGKVPVKKNPPSYLIRLEVSYLVLLLGIGALFEFIKIFPSHIFFIPIGIFWWSTLGAVLISLYALYEHNNDWESKYNLWHSLKIIHGPAIGAISFLLFSIITQLATNSKPIPTHYNNVSFIFYAVAFLSGFREKNLKDLIAHATDLLFKTDHPSDPKKP